MVRLADERLHVPVHVCRGSFIARRERPSHGRGGTYWKAYRRSEGRLHRVYLGARAEQGDVEEARVFCQRGMQLAIETANTWTLADGQRIMASICLRQGEYTDAREWAEKASAHFVEIGDSTNAAVALRVAAEVAEQEGDAERARSLLERARSLSDATPLTG